MLYALTYKEIATQSALFIGQFRLRHREFIERQAYDVVDRLFNVAELRLGEKHQAIVRITRTDKPTVAKASAIAGGRHD